MSTDLTVTIRPLKSRRVPIQLARSSNSSLINLASIGSSTTPSKRSSKTNSGSPSPTSISRAVEATSQAARDAGSRADARREQSRRGSGRNQMSSYDVTLSSSPIESRHTSTFSSRRTSGLRDQQFTFDLPHTKSILSALTSSSTSSQTAAPIPLTNISTTDELLQRQHTELIAMRTEFARIEALVMARHQEEMRTFQAGGSVVVSGANPTF